MSAVITLTEPTFMEEIQGSPIPVLVDFWAEWCGPCKTIAPLLEEIASEETGRIKIGKLNVDEAPNTARDHLVMSIPTLILFTDGEPVLRMIGAKPKESILAELEPYL